MTAPRWFTVIAVLALIWNIIGLLAFAGDVSITVEDLQQLPEAQRALYEATPVWVTALFGLAVVTGTLGSLGLVLKRSLARPLLAVSLAAVVLQTGWTLLFSDAVAMLGQQVVIMSVLLIVIAAALLLLAQQAVKKGWLT